MRVEALLAAGVLASLAGACKGSTNNLAPVEDAPSNGNGDGGGGNGDAANNRADATPVADAAPAPYCTPKAGTTLKLTPVAAGLANPVFVAAPARDPRVFIVDQPGLIRVIKDGSLLATPFLDFDDLPLAAADELSASGDERGLLGLAFHPDYARNGRFFVHYTTSAAIIIAEYSAEPSADVARTAAGKVLIREPHRQENHNGGMVQFGPDGYLYFSIGDGGGANNSEGGGQSTDKLLGKINRIDVNRDPYGIPADNPWATSGGVKEMFAWGLRNPYRFWIDFDTNNIFIGDVGQARYEEVDVIPGGEPGLNFGWPLCEGNKMFREQEDPAGQPPLDLPACTAAGMTGAVIAYDQRDTVDRDNPCAVIGGVVYRGTCMPDMAGHYFFGDKCTGKVQTFAYQEGTTPRPVDHSTDLDERLLSGNLSGFGTDGYGELYVTSLAGSVYRVEVR